MFQLRRLVLLVAAAAALAAGQPALTTIQDILYRADGTRFSGSMTIRYSSFQAGDTANIATALLTLQIVNGVLSVKLVPTTTATAGAQYNITYNSQGRTQFTEVWAVPPSSLTMRVRDVRLSTGVVVGPAPVTTPVQIGDVVGLSNALSVRPTEGIGFGPGRTAVINQAGQIDGAAGGLSDCVHVDGSSGACGGGGGVFSSFADAETPAGTIDGSNMIFTLHFPPVPAGSLEVFRNGLLMKQPIDYTLSGNIITFVTAGTPQVGDVLLASYRYADPNNLLGSLTTPQVVCSSNGTSTSATVLTPLGTCTIPGGLLATGDRIEVQFHYAHTGTATAFTGEIFWGSTVLVNRSGLATEPAFVGRTTLGIFAGGQSWDAESWGSSLSQANGVGSATENASINLTVFFRALMAGTTTDTIALRNFTVIRYPAQTNP